jgi:hypothetical protein
MDTRFLAADIQSCQKTRFFGTSCLGKSCITSARIEVQSSFYADFKTNEMPFPVTCCTNIFSTVMYPRSSNLTFDLVFLKIRYSNFFLIYCVHVTIIQNICKYQVGAAMGLGYEKHFTCTDEAISSNMFLLNSLHLLI